MTTELQLDGHVLSFDEDRREMELLLLPWDTDVENAGAVHRFERGAFKEVDPKRIVTRMRHQDPPTGRGYKLTEEDDGPHLFAKISKTVAGDEQLTLARDGVEDGVSVAFDTSDNRKEQLQDGRTRYTHVGFSKARQIEASTTWKPAFTEGAKILNLMEAQDVAEAQKVEDAKRPEPQATEAQLKAVQDTILEKFEAMQDRVAALGLQMPDSLKRQSEGVQRQVQFGADLNKDEVLTAFELDDVISSDNPGVFPEIRSATIIGIIDSSRPFLESTTRDATPPAGEVWRFPKITQRPTVAKQTNEKDEVSSQKTTITSDTFNMQTYAGAGDLSIQLIKRSSPDFLNLWSQLLGEDYAIKTDDAALDALLAVGAVVEGTGSFDPSSPSFGEAFSNAAAAANNRPGLLPNRIWLGTAALVAFINAKSPTGGGGTPLYPGLASIAGIQGGGNGAGPAGFNMTPVWVPAMDDKAVDIIIGPSRGFHWVEDGTYTLTADVPAKAGRDVGLVGMIWFAPVYPAAFTTYALAS